MAIIPQNNEAFLREVDEELRRDRVESFARHYGKIVIGVVVAGLVALAGYLYWEHRKSEAAGLEGEQLSQALDALARKNAGEATPKLAALAASEHAGVSALARLTQADAALEKNDDKAALATLKAIAADGDAPEAYRQLALIRQTATEFDALPPAEVIGRLTPLAVAGEPWFGSAGELVALAQLKQGNKAAAGQGFAAIARDTKAPETIRARATQMAGMLGVDANAAAAPATR